MGLSQTRGNIGYPTRGSILQLSIAHHLCNFESARLYFPLSRVTRQQALKIHFLACFLQAGGLIPKVPISFLVQLRITEVALAFSCNSSTGFEIALAFPF